MPRRHGTPKLWLPPAALLLSGCTTPALLATAGFSAVREGTYAHTNGELAAAELASLPQVREAVLTALERLQFTVRTNRARDWTVFIRATDRTGEIKISLSERTAAVTKVRIRVGTFGDQALSRFLLQEIDRELSDIRARDAATPPDQPPPSSP